MGTDMSPRLVILPEMKWLIRAQWDPVRILWIRKINVTSDELPEISAQGAAPGSVQGSAHTLGKQTWGESAGALGKMF